MGTPAKRAQLGVQGSVAGRVIGRGHADRTRRGRAPPLRSGGPAAGWLSRGHVPASRGGRRQIPRAQPASRRART
eukprot:5096802-Lingulodinium_polyedra.AAC.1